MSDCGADAYGKMLQFGTAGGHRRCVAICRDIGETELKRLLENLTAAA